MGRNTVYKDLGNIIETETVANGEYAESEWFDNYYWVRRFLFKVRANGNYTVVLYRRNSADTPVSDLSTSVLVSTTATGTSFAGIEYEAVGGYSFKVAIQNNSGGNLDIEANLEVFR